AKSVTINGGAMNGGHTPRRHGQGGGYIGLPQSHPFRSRQRAKGGAADWQRARRRSVVNGGKPLEGGHDDRTDNDEGRAQPRRERSWAAPRRARFVEEYAVDLCGKQAAIRAGYSPKTAEVQAARMSRLVKVQQAVQAALPARSARTEMTQDFV